MNSKLKIKSQKLFNLKVLHQRLAVKAHIIHHPVTVPVVLERADQEQVNQIKTNIAIRTVILMKTVTLNTILLMTELIPHPTREEIQILVRDKNKCRVLLFGIAATSLDSIQNRQFRITRFRQQ